VNRYRITFKRRSPITNTEVNDIENVSANSTKEAEAFIKDKFAHTVITIIKTTKL